MKNGKWGGECLRWARTTLGLPPLGYTASAVKPNSFTPELNSIVLFSFNHAAIVVGIIGDSIITADANLDRRGTIQIGKTYKVDDERIRGYVSQSRLSAL